MALMNLGGRTPIDLPNGAYDVRGWQVRTRTDGENVGKVDDMLIDDQNHPRYLDVDLGIFRRHILLPLSEAHADPAEQTVWIDRLDRERLRDIPAYDPASVLTPEYEQRLAAEYRVLAETDTAAVEDAPPPALARLGDLAEYRVAKGVTDPRGWKLVGGDGQVLGEIVELIVDSRAMSTRYLDCRLDEDKLELEHVDRHILVPTERVRLDRKKKQGVVDGLFARDLKGYPVYQGLPLDGLTERRIESVFESRTDTTPEAFGRSFFGARSRAAGGTDDTTRVLSRGRPAGDDASSREVRVARGADGDEVRIRISGDDIIIERPSRGSQDDG